MVDVIIVGGGPAGSTLGCYLSMAGISNLIIEKAVHPRPHVGESMVTATTRIFQDIGFLETMERAGFVHKYGASWHTTSTMTEADIAFREFPQEGINQDYTYHVDRAKFDLLLLKHAQALGSKVYQGIPVKEVLFEDARATGVKVGIAGQDVNIPAKIVADASGRDTLLGRQLKLVKKDPIFDQYAVHAWFEGVDKSGATGDYIHIYFLPVERGWAWQIPITEEITSMGIVAEREIFRDSNMNVEAYFDAHVQSNPSLKHALCNARRVNEFKREADYSYSMSSFGGDGFVLLGDAARFVDPIFSSGVSVAMHSAKFASQAITEAFASGDFSAASFQQYEKKLRAGVEIWYDFIRLYYKLLPLFTRFIQSPKHRLGLLQLLQGDVYDREAAPEVLQAMREYIEVVEQSDSHIWKKDLAAIPIG